MGIQTVLFEPELFPKWEFFKDYRECREMQDLLNLADRNLSFLPLPKIGPEESAVSLYPKVIDKKDLKSPNTILGQLATLIHLSNIGEATELLPLDNLIILWHYSIDNINLGVVTFTYESTTNTRKVTFHPLEQKVNKFWIWTCTFKYHRF